MSSFSDNGAFGVPSYLLEFPVEDLDISKPIVSLLKKLGFTVLGDLDALSHAEFRRYIRSFPKREAIVVKIDEAIGTLRLNSIRLDPSLSRPTLRQPEAHANVADPLTNQSTVPPFSGDLNETEAIHIPHELRGENISCYDVSVRLRHILEQANIRLLSDLNGRTFAGFGKYRNCGKKTVTELRDLVRQLQQGRNGFRHPNDGTATENPNLLAVPEPIHDLKLTELPISVRLENALRHFNFKTLADLNGMDLLDLLDLKNCGRKSIAELRELVRRAATGEFSAPPVHDIVSCLYQVASGIDTGLAQVSSRDQKILEERLFGNNGSPRTLEAVGTEFKMTRERVRQIVKSTMQKIRRGGGPKLARAVEVVARECQQRVCPLTAELFTHWLGDHRTNLQQETQFYLRVLDEMEQTIPAWPLGSTREGADDPLSAKLDDTLQNWLRESDVKPTAHDAYLELCRRPDFQNLSVSTFLAALRRGQKIIVDLANPDRPELRLRQMRMTILEFARRILGSSPVPLTPEEIVNAARTKYGEDAIVVSGRGAGNTLTPANGFFLLGARRFGLRRHFKLLESQWPALRQQFAALLAVENRPISTIEAIDRQRITGFDDTDSYEMAEIIRGDPQFIDLGRKLFALADWGIQEREHINALLPRVFSEAKHALTIQQTLARLTRLRSVSPNSIANTLQKHPAIRSLGFGYYGLTKWGVAERQVMLSNPAAVESAVRRATPPVTFQVLCETFGISANGKEATLLWRTCARSTKLRRAPDRHSPDTLLLHKAISLELALATIARALRRPAPAYELEWELSAKFGTIFEHIGLAAIEERLARSSRFLRNAAGEFLLDTQVDLEGYDVNALRIATINSLVESADIVASDELIERLEQHGFDVSDLSADMLSSILRGTKELQEIGHQRFRAK